jgi:hypothetical protein
LKKRRGEMSKQFLLMVDEMVAQKVRATLTPEVQFLEVQGMNMQDNNRFSLLVTPLPPPPPTEGLEVENA